MACDLHRRPRVVEGKQARAQGRFPDPPAGIDPRAQQKSGVVGIRSFLDPGHVGQGAQANVAAPCEHLEPLCDISSIEAFQRHHVADGAQRDQVQPLAQVRLGPALLVVPSALAQLSIHRDDQQECDADRSEAGQPAFVVQPIWVYHRRRRGQARARPCGDRRR